nr:MAG TPA: hypothetical protein [Caudoviricetes sp.]
MQGFLPIKSAYYLLGHSHDSQSELNHLKWFFLYPFAIDLNSHPLL